MLSFLSTRLQKPGRPWYSIVSVQFSDRIRRRAAVLPVCGVWGTRVRKSVDTMSDYNQQPADAAEVDEPENVDKKSLDEMNEHVSLGSDLRSVHGGTGSISVYTALEPGPDVYPTGPVDGFSKTRVPRSVYFPWVSRPVDRQSISMAFKYFFAPRTRFLLNTSWGFFFFFWISCFHFVCLMPKTRVESDFTGRPHT